MVFAASDISQEFALAPLDGPILQESLEPAGTNKDLGLDLQDISEPQRLTLLGHMGSTEASVRQEDNLGGLGHHRAEDMEQAILKVVLGSVDVLIPIDRPQQREGSPSQPGGQDQALEAPQVHPIQADQELPAGLGQPLDDPSHGLDGFDPFVADETIHAFDGVLAGRAYLGGQHPSALGQRGAFQCRRRASQDAQGFRLRTPKKGTTQTEYPPDRALAIHRVHPFWVSSAHRCPGSHRHHREWTLCSLIPPPKLGMSQCTGSKCRCGVAAIGEPVVYSLDQLYRSHHID
jgi:hypothetical protein